MRTQRLTPSLPLALVAAFLIATLPPAHAQRTEGQPGPPPRGGQESGERPNRPADRERQIDRLEHHRQQLLEKLEAQRADGKEPEAMAVKKELLRVEQELEELRAGANVGPDRQRPPGPPPRPAGRPDREHERAQPDRPPGSPPNREEAERRLHHLEIAIENLHAAGLHEPAERLNQQADRIREHLQATNRRQPESPSDRPGRSGRRARQGPQAGGPPDGPANPDALNALRGEVRRLQAQVERLNRRMDEMSRDRR